MWYYLEIYISTVGGRSKLNDDKTVITRHDDHSTNFDTCRGSIIMPSINNDLIYEYTIKLLKVSVNDQVAIGIDDVGGINNGCFIGAYNSNNYGYQCWNARKSCRGDYAGTHYGQAETDGAIVTMIYNSYKATLSFIVDGRDYGIAYEKGRKGKEIDYRLAIYFYAEASVQLIGFSKKSAI